MRFASFRTVLPVSGSNSSSSAYKPESSKLSISGLFSKAKYIASDFSGAFIVPARAFSFNALSGTERICFPEASCDAAYTGSCIISAGKASDTDESALLQEMLSKEVKTKTKTPRSRIYIFYFIAAFKASILSVFSQLNSERPKCP